MKLSDIRPSREIVVSGLITMVSVAASEIFSRFTNARGEVQFARDSFVRICGAIASPVLGLIVYSWSLRKKESKRERVRFARETGRTICPCTEIGEVTVAGEWERDGVRIRRFLQCPVCHRIYPFDEPKKDQPLFVEKK